MVWPCVALLRCHSLVLRVFACFVGCMRCDRHIFHIGHRAQQAACPNALPCLHAVSLVTHVAHCCPANCIAMENGRATAAEAGRHAFCPD
jgi:hypothetical protein